MRTLVIGIGNMTMGLAAGIYYEKHRQQFSLNAATPVIPSPDVAVPPIIEPSSKPVDNKLARVGTIMRHGYPSFDSLRTFDNFVLSYDRRLRAAGWVFEHMTPESVTYNPEINRQKCDFFEDKAIHPFFRAKNDDFKGSGYDRGHLAAAGNHRLSQAHCAQTFVLSNISPQVGRGFNRNVWNRLERYVRFRARRSKNLWSCTGPLYLPRFENGKKYIKYEVIGESDVSVPTHFFKVILVENKDGSFELESFVIQNRAMDDNITLEAFHVPLESIERAAGFLIFDKVKSIKSVNEKKHIQMFLKKECQKN